MKIEEFATALAEKLEEKFEGRYIIQTGERKKWNQTVYKILQFVKVDNKKVSPCIYVNPYYRSFIDDNTTIDEIAGFIKTEFEQECLPKAEKLETLDVNEVMSWESVNDKIFPRLINKIFNAEYLETIPHKGFINLACIYHILVEETEKYSLTVIVNNNHMKLWGISSVDLIHKVAMENARNKTPAVLSPMSSIIAELIMGYEPDAELEEVLLKESEEPHMYVYTNKSRKYGATALLYDLEQIKEFADQEGRDLLILPSSIHEVIIIPMLEHVAGEIEKYLQIVKDVNREDMDPEEILADNVYIYRRDNEEIEIVA